MKNREFPGKFSSFDLILGIKSILGGLKMKCTQCGKNNGSRDKFCKNCGSSLNSSSEQYKRRRVGFRIGNGLFIKTVIILVLSVVCLFFISKTVGGIKFGSLAKSDSTIITERIEKLCNLATVKYNYADIASMKKASTIFDVEIPLTEKKFLIKFNAYINAGCSLQKFEKVNRDTVKVTLNKGRILDNVLVIDSVYEYDSTQSIFNKLSFEDYKVEINTQMKKYEEQNKEEIIKNAENNARIIITDFMKSLGYKNVDIQLK